MAKESQIAIIATNRKAGRDYELLDRLEAGIVLTGTEIKSLRQHSANLNDSFARIVRGEIFLYHCHISPYAQGNRFNVDPVRNRKLLLHRKEIERLIGQTARKGHSLIPTKLYLKHGLVKVELAVGKGRREYEKRDAIRRAETRRELEQAQRRRR